MTDPTEPSPWRRVAALGSLILAGESIFIPMFHLGRYFKSSFLETFDLTELELGEAQAWYGVVAMACYALGGPIADRVAPRLLMVGSLLATAATSLLLVSIPGLFTLKLLYGFWGASTILAFWAPLIRATREWGGQPAQGRAFGFLDGGRGLVAALVVTVASNGVGLLLGDGALDDPQRARSAMQGLALFYSALCVLAALAVGVFVTGGPTEPRGENEESRPPDHSPLADTLWALGQPVVWLQALVVITAYSAYKGFSFYGLYVEDACGFSAEQSTEFVGWINYLRVVATIGAGVLADRVGSPAAVVAGCFGVLAACFGWLATAPGATDAYALVLATIATASAATFALRGIYFALLKESGVPRRLTGAAVGVVSFIGYTPDIFMPWISGWFVTTARESGDVLVGYSRFYGLLGVLAVVGLVAATLLRRRHASE